MSNLSYNQKSFIESIIKQEGYGIGLAVVKGKSIFNNVEGYKYNTLAPFLLPESIELVPGLVGFINVDGIKATWDYIFTYSFVATAVHLNLTGLIAFYYDLALPTTNRYILAVDRLNPYGVTINPGQTFNGALTIKTDLQ